MPAINANPIISSTAAPLPGRRFNDRRTHHSSQRGLSPELTEPCFRLYGHQPSALPPSNLPPDHVQFLAEAARLSSALDELAARYVEKYADTAAYIDPIDAFAISFQSLLRIISHHLAKTKIDELDAFGARASCRRTATLAANIAQLSEELLSFVERGGETMATELGYATKWPANISIRLDENVAASSRSISINAQNKYHTINSSLGKELPQFQRSKKTNIFHNVAAELYCSTLSNLCFARQDRSLGLPWLLDYIDSDNTIITVRDIYKFHEIDSGKRSLSRSFYYYPELSLLNEEQIEILIALRYYIHLTLSPLKYRTEAQRVWQDFRKKIFNESFKKKSSTGGKKYWIEDNSKPEGSLLNLNKRKILNISHHSVPGDWFRSYLLSNPEDIFGTNKPITEWDYPEIKNIKSWDKCTTEFTIFSACCREILKAFLKLTKPYQNAQLPVGSPNPPQQSKAENSTNAIDFQNINIKKFQRTNKFTKLPREFPIGDVTMELRSRASLISDRDYL